VINHQAEPPVTATTRAPEPWLERQTVDADVRIACGLIVGHREHAIAGHREREGCAVVGEMAGRSR
jgi:hypothetical protein